MDSDSACVPVQHQRLSDAKGYRGKNSRRGRVRFMPNSRARVQLGALPSAALPGLPPTDMAGSTGCILCCERLPSYVSVGACGHSDVCWVCAVRLRALSCDNHCPVCKMDLETVVLTNNVSTESFKHRDLKQMATNEELGLHFSDSTIEKEVAALFRYQCTMENCANQNSCRFSKLEELEDHLWYVHWRQLCQTCLLDRPAFLCEQYTYCSHDMHRHCREGDSSHDGMLALPAHHFCKFCKQYFFGEVEFHQHMHMTHHLCHICERMGRRNEFYASLQSLSLHYQQHHHVCAHADCVQNGFRFIAFADEEELRLHYLSEHHRDKGSSDRRLRLNIGQVSYTASNPRRNVRNALAESIGCEIRFMWPAGATLRDSEPDSSSGTRDSFRQRYPYRDLSKDCVVSDVQPVLLTQLATSSAAFAAEHDNFTERLLDVQVESLELTCTVARSGPRCGARCATDAISAVVSSLTITKTSTVSKAEVHWKKSLQGLSGSEIEGLEHMRAHLEEVGDIFSSCNWEPLERVLSLRPLFVRLLCQEQSHGRQREVIGPKGAALKNDAEQWLKWKAAAQSAVLTLGELEQQCVAIYLKLCLERRDGTTWLEEHKDADIMFPLLDGETQRSENARWTSNRGAPLPGEMPEGQFPVLGNPVDHISNDQSAWAKPLQERRSNWSRCQAPVAVACSRASKKVAAEKRAAEALARIVAARADYQSRCVDHWEDWT